VGGRHSRNKGKRFEREVADRMRALFPEAAASIKRGWQSRAGHDAADVEGVPYLWIEAKAHRVAPLRPALTQAIEARDAAKSTKLPVAICKSDREAPVVVMLLEDFEALVIALRGDRLAHFVEVGQSQ